MSKKHKFHNLLWFLLGVIIIILLCIIVEWSKAHAFEQHDAMTIYTMTTDEPLTIAWDDADTNIDYEIYQFYLWNFGEEKKYAIGNTQQIQVTMYVPRTGLWVFYCRTHIEYDKSSNWATYQDYTLEQLVTEVNTNEYLYETKKDLTVNPNMTKEQILQSIQNYGFNSIYASSDKLEFAQVKDPTTGLYIAGKWMIYGHIAAPTGGGVE